LTGQQTLIARAALGVFAGAASILACSNGSLRRMESPKFDRLAILSFIATRLGLFGLIFFVLHIPPRGDVPSYYWPQANSILKGLLPYRDFVSSYAPLHPSLDAMAIRIWHSPLAIILLAVVVEFALLPLWLHFGRTLLSEAEVRTATLLYLFSSVGLQFVAVDGQDTVIVGVLLALAMFFLAQRNEVLSGASLGLAISAIKFLPLIYAPAFFVALAKRWRWAVGLVLPIAVIYGGALAMHLPILMPLHDQGDIKGAGNLPYVIESLLGINLPSRLLDGILVLVLAGIFYQLWRIAEGASPEARLRALTFAMAALTLAMLLFSKKSWSSYLTLALFPIGLLIDARRRLELLGFALLGVIAVIEHSYWATLLHQVNSQELHQGLLSGRATFYVFFAIELVLLAGYAWLLGVAWRKMSAASQEVPDEASTSSSAAVSHRLTPSR
jgi:hypothetical protein